MALLLGFTSFSAFVILCLYLKWFLKKFRNTEEQFIKLLTVLLVTAHVLEPQNAQACALCFGGDGPLQGAYLLSAIILAGSAILIMGVFVYFLYKEEAIANREVK